MVLAGERRPGLHRAGCESALPEGFLDALRVRGSDALVDGECLLQVHRGLAGGAVVDVAAADAFQGARFIQRRADVAGDGQRLVVIVAGLLAGSALGR